MTKKAVAYVFMVTLGLWFLAAPAVAAPQYLGETTWTVAVNQDKNGPINPAQTATVKGCITHQGGPYYTAQLFISGPSGNPIESGGGILVNGTLYLTLCHSQKQLDNDREIGVTHAELDQTTLNGTFYTVTRSFVPSTAGSNPVFKDNFSAGTLTRTGSAINLTPWASVSSTTLLLLKK